MPESSVQGAPLLEIKDLRTYLTTDGGMRTVKAVDGISFTLGRGETLGIIGESGSGKTMAALSVMRLLPKAARIVGGQVLFNGEDLLKKSDEEMRRLRGSQIGMIFQDPMVALDPLYTVGDQMAEPLQTHRHLGGAAVRDRSIQLLDQFSISTPEGRLRQYPHQMSGGMLQRIVGAIAISCEPQLVIADEPTTALDPTVQAQFLDLLEGLKQKQNLSVIVVTHDFGVAARLCDKIVVMYAGKIVESGPVREIFHRPSHPYTRALLGALPRRHGLAGEGRHRRLPTIEGQPPDLSNLKPGCAFAPRCAIAEAKCHDQDPPREQIEPGHDSLCWRAGPAPVPDLIPAGTAPLGTTATGIAP